MAILHMEYKSTCLKRDVPVNIILPFDRGGSAPYPTVYLLHGLQGNQNTWLYNTRIERWACDRNLAVVIPAGENSFWVDTCPHGGPLGDFGTYVGKELVEVTRELFPLARERERTFIGGFSMGGYGALRNGLVYRETFSRLALFAPAVHFFEQEVPDDVAGETLLFAGPDARESDLNPRWLVERIAKSEGSAAFPQVKMVVGAGDGLRTSDEAIATALSCAGAKVDFSVREGIHSWNFVQANLEEMLDWLVESETEGNRERQLD